MNIEMDDIIDEMKNRTDCWPWYWISNGEKCYAFAVVEAYQIDENKPLPKPGSKLEMGEGEEIIWVGNNGTEMMLESTIVQIEKQNGDIICEFIANAHANFMGDILIEN